MDSLSSWKRISTFGKKKKGNEAKRSGFSVCLKWMRVRAGYQETASVFVKLILLDRAICHHCVSLALFQCEFECIKTDVSHKETDSSVCSRRVDVVNGKEEERPIKSARSSGLIVE